MATSYSTFRHWSLDPGPCVFEPAIAGACLRKPRHAQHGLTTAQENKCSLIPSWPPEVETLPVCWCSCIMVQRVEEELGHLTLETSGSNQVPRSIYFITGNLLGSETTHKKCTLTITCKNMWHDNREMERFCISFSERSHRPFGLISQKMQEILPASSLLPWSGISCATWFQRWEEIAFIHYFNQNTSITEYFSKCT